VEVLMKSIKYILVIMIGLLFVGCSNAEERMNDKAILEIDRGNFIKASYLLSDAININPNYLDGMVNYRNVYPRALDQADENIKEYQKVFDYKLEAYAYEDLLKLKGNYYYADDVIHQKLGMSLDLPTIEELYQLKLTMGEIYYKAGSELEGRPLNRMEKRDRYYLYERGVELSPKYKDMVTRREVAYKEALVKAMVDFSYNIPSRSKGELEIQIKGNVARGKKKSIIRLAPLNKYEFDQNWGNNSVSRDLNTGIKVSLDYKTVVPESLKKKIVPKVWYEEYIVQTKDGPIRKKIARTYFRHEFYKSASVKVSFTYIMKDLSTGEIIGSGTFEGIGEDNYRWYVYTGNIPSGQTRGGYERRLKTRDELTKLAFSDAISKLAKDISNEI
jgi:tetratricopeptide (TPR) repeat protein